MPFHWCYQETEALFMLLASIPLIGLFFRKLHAKWHAKWKTLCGNKECHEEHPVEAPVSTPTEEWDAISFEDARERFGAAVFANLDLYQQSHRLPYPVAFDCSVNDKGELRVITCPIDYVYDGEWRFAGVNNLID